MCTRARAHTLSPHPPARLHLHLHMHTRACTRGTWLLIFFLDLFFVHTRRREYWRWLGQVQLLKSLCTQVCLCLSVCLSVCLSTCLSLGLSVCLSVCVCVSVCLCVYRDICGDQSSNTQIHFQRRCSTCEQRINRGRGTGEGWCGLGQEGEREEGEREKGEREEGERDTGRCGRAHRSLLPYR